VTPADLWEQFRDAMWEGRWFALQSLWNAGLQHPWVLVVFGIAVALKGRRALASAARWIGATVWHHARD